MRYLLEQGGAATREQLLERFGGKTTTWRDFKRQTLADLLGARRSYEGQPLQVGPPVIALDDSGVHLVENWREALEEHRIIGQEPEAADEQKRRDLAQSRAFREFLKGTNPPDEAPTDEDLAEGREERQRRRRAEARVAEGMAPPRGREGGPGSGRLRRGSPSRGGGRSPRSPRGRRLGRSSPRLRVPGLLRDAAEVRDPGRV